MYCMCVCVCWWKRLQKAVFWWTLAYMVSVEPKQIHKLAKIWPIAYVALLAGWWKIFAASIGPKPECTDGDALIGWAG